jgi:inosine-uridine nucleoside N-ribohydrolase
LPAFNGRLFKNAQYRRVKMKRKIIIDTDPGHDDAMALMLAVKSNKFDILAVTTVAGNSTIENTTRNARYIMGLLESKVPVYSGSKKPLMQSLTKAVVHGKSGLEGIDPKNRPDLTNNAVGKIVEIVTREKDVTLVTLGPLTNIAKAILKAPKTMVKLKEIVMMGGAVKVAGNKNRVAEFNIFVDPDAAKIVFDFPVKKTIVPLDACNNIKLYLDDFKKIRNKQLREPLLKMVVPYMNNTYKNEGVRAALMYDPLTVYYLLELKACATEMYNIKIETEGEFTRGMTVADLRMKPEEKSNVCVVMQIDEAKFKECFIKTLSQS